MRFRSSIFILFFVLFVFSCGMSPDDMVEEYNTLLVTNVENTTTKTNKVIRLETLLDWESQSIKKDYLFRTSVKPSYISYEWTLTDSQQHKILIVENCDFVYINTKALALEIGQYIISVKVINKIGNVYTDSAILEVIE